LSIKVARKTALFTAHGVFIEFKEITLLRCGLEIVVRMATEGRSWLRLTLGDQVGDFESICL